MKQKIIDQRIKDELYRLEHPKKVSIEEAILRGDFREIDKECERMEKDTL